MGYTKGLITGLTFGFFLGAMAGTLVIAGPCDNDYSYMWNKKTESITRPPELEDDFHVGYTQQGDRIFCTHTCP